MCLYLKPTFLLENLQKYFAHQNQNSVTFRENHVESEKQHLRWINMTRMLKKQKQQTTTKSKKVQHIPGFSSGIWSVEVVCYVLHHKPTQKRDKKASFTCTKCPLIPFEHTFWRQNQQTLQADSTLVIVIMMVVERAVEHRLSIQSVSCSFGKRSNDGNCLTMWFTSFSYSSNHSVSLCMEGIDIFFFFFMFLHLFTHIFPSICDQMETN